MTDHSHLIVFGRYPRAGLSKTRLIPVLGPAGAAELQKRLTEKTIAAARRAASRIDARLVFCHDGGNAKQLRRWLGGGIRFAAQCSGDLGQRMHLCIKHALESGARRVVLVGTDIPGMTSDLLEQAFGALSQRDLVFGPSLDGGYWLVGMTRPEDIFEGIVWSRPDVLDKSLALGRKKGMKVHLLAPLNDLDTPEDLAREGGNDPSPLHRLSATAPAIDGEKSGRSARKQTAAKRRKSEWLTAVVANEKGEIFDLEGFAAVGADGPLRLPITTGETIDLPHGSELMFLPDRIPVLMDLKNGRIGPLDHDPDRPEERIYPVAAFNSPGVLVTRSCAYDERPTAQILPLFSYGAVGWHGSGFRSAAIVVDREPRQDLRRMPRQKIISGVEEMRTLLPHNRLARHLEHCALTYGCPAGKNFFLGRYEAPLPTSRACNARCLGCISLQQGEGLRSSQNRIAFTPSPQEIAEVALAHIGRVKNSVISFGQGCEGDPLMAARIIGPAITLIREKTTLGTINMNTNASLPSLLAPLLDAGLDSIRVSMNSVREACYTAYFRPKGYRFAQVLESIDLAIDRGCHVAVNYMNCPGFTDSPEEAAALAVFLENHPVHLIQWRNLNFDPRHYLLAMNRVCPHGSPVGMDRLLQMIRKRFPRLQFGYFNPPKERFAVTLPASNEESP